MASSKDPTSISSISPLTSANYRLWADDMKSWLQLNGLWRLVSGQEKKPAPIPGVKDYPLFFPLPPPLGLGFMSTTVPPISSSAAAKPKCSPPTAEELCLKTFRSCWHLDKSWLISFVASAQRKMPTSPITWVEFMPQGHTHLVRSALKLVSPTKSLPVAKIKEVMFTFVLDVLNESAPCADFFKARKAAKPRKRTPRRKGKGGQSDGMAVDAPEPSTAVEGSSQEPEALRGDVDPPPLEGSSEPLAHTQHFPGPSSEEPRDGGSSLEDPRASFPSTPLPVEPELQAPVAALALSDCARKLLRAREKMAAPTLLSPLPPPLG